MLNNSCCNSVSRRRKPPVTSIFTWLQKKHVPCQGAGYCPPRGKCRSSWSTKPPSCVIIMISRVQPGPSMTGHTDAKQIYQGHQLVVDQHHPLQSMLCQANKQVCTHCLSSNHSRTDVHRPPPPIGQLPNITHSAQAPPPKKYADHIMLKHHYKY